jgi:hypothetical protein
MSDLLDLVTTATTINEYTRSYGGMFGNPYGGSPSLSFSMHRVKVQANDGTLISASPLADARESYAPGKVYNLYDPTTALVIPGQTFVSDRFFAEMYSIMRRSLLDAQIREMTKAVDLTDIALQNAQVVLANADEDSTPAARASVDAAVAAKVAAQAILDAAKALLPV